ncbi:MAG: hypothetical protein K0S23_2212 [Fluviicola sp.]|jgi:hypothetical protein|uniref:hypothetical protein n=1 Tax=Fluviicola sp. TaxID=1917219 RepID=UPI00262EC8F9|nr:hypothetical protein [Fluviicola sp.]MDF3027905.1 hypothetical protein [Fluviicola sp.]
MIITQQIEDAVLGFNAIWVVIHFSYFSFYYSRYSACFHKLRSMDLLEKANLYEQELIDITRENTWKKIKKLQRISYFPTLGIAVLHLVVFYFYWEREIFGAYYTSAFYILIGGLVFMFLANKTQGARVLRGGRGGRGSFFRGPF